MARLKPFGPSRFLYSGRGKKEEDWEDGAEFVSFEQLLQHSDFVLVTCAYSPELHHKFDKAAFAAMKSSAVFINTSRGGIVNQEDLAEALSTNQVKKMFNVCHNSFARYVSRYLRPVWT